MGMDEVAALINDALSNAAQQPELPDDAQQMPPQFEQVDPQFEQMMQQEQQQMPMDMGGGGDMSGVQLPDLQQDDEVM